MHPDDHARILTVDRVEWLPSSPDAIEVRVLGAWHGPTVPPAVVLLVGAARFAALPAPPREDVPPGWSAAFHVPVEVRPAVEEGSLALDVDGDVLTLPPAEPGRITAPPAPTGGTLVDPAVLAERRARRAEIAERSATERAASAEESADTLRVQLSHLEERLSRAADERDALAARVADAERRLRLAEQREEAERRRRGELEEELVVERREAEDEVHDLHEELASAEELTEVLERELAYARHRAELDRAARERADEQLREALERVAQLEGGSGSEAEELRRQAEALGDRLAELEAERGRLAAGHVPAERLEEAQAEAAELRGRLARVEGTLRARLAEAEKLRGEVETLRGRLAEAESAQAGAAAAQREIESLKLRLAAAEARTTGSSSARETELAAQVAALQAELASRAETHARVQEAIDQVRDELGRVREEVHARGRAAAAGEIEALEQQVRERDAELAALRSALADAREAAEALRTRLADADRRRVASEEHLREDFDTRIGKLTDEVAAMRRRLHETTTDFETRLADERRRREAAEAAGGVTVEAPRVPETPGRVSIEVAGEAATPPRGEDEPTVEVVDEEAFDTLITGLRAQVDTAREQLDDLEAPEAVPADEVTRRRLQEIEADLRAAVPKPEASVPARDLIASLQQAADRLRTAAEEELSRIDEDPAADAPAEAAATPEAPAVPAATAEAAATPAAPAVPGTPEAVGEGAGAAPPAPLGPRPVDFGAAESRWLRTAIERLAVTEPTRAADLLVALLPAQATTGVRLTYLLTAPSLGAVKVALADGAATVERAPESALADARISGSLATLAPLAAGGAGRRLRGVKVHGSKRSLRKLVRARRRALGLDDLLVAGPPPSPGTLLAALAAAVDPAWTTGHRFGVAYVVAGAGRWTVVAEDGAPLKVVEGPEHPHAAVVALTPEAVLPVLQGAAPPHPEQATVAGDRRAVDVLHGWFDAARGVASS